MKKKGLFIGLTTVDIQYFVGAFPKSNTKIKAEKPLIGAGGPAANAAVSYAALGGQAVFISCIGVNQFQQIIRNDFENQGVEILDACAGKPYEPILATIVTETTTSHRNIVSHHPEKLQINELPEIDPSIFDFVFIDGFYSELAKPICERAKAEKIPVIFDGGSWKPQLPEILPLVDVAICSENFHPPGCISSKDVFQYLRRVRKNMEIAISRGARSILTGHEEIKVDTVEAIDSLAAGDILHGAFCWYFTREENFESALRKASKVASFSTIHKGTRSWINALKQ